MRLLDFFRSPKAAVPERARRGQIAEKAAAKFLRRQGYKIIQRNWRSGRDEIDLICKDGEVMVFVEVRARQKGALVSGYDSVRGRKKEALRRVCRNYRYSLRTKPHTWRLDIVDVQLTETGSVHDLRHHENIGL